MSSVKNHWETRQEGNPNLSNSSIDLRVKHQRYSGDKIEVDQMRRPETAEHTPGRIQLDQINILNAESETYKPSFKLGNDQAFPRSAGSNGSRFDGNPSCEITVMSNQGAERRISEYASSKDGLQESRTTEGRFIRSFIRSQYQPAGTPHGNAIYIREPDTAAKHSPSPGRKKKRAKSSSHLKVPISLTVETRRLAPDPTRKSLKE